VNLGVAKDQRLSLNPSQISGACGRLMCCLRYEHEFYVQSRKRFPKEGKIIKTKQGEEKVVANDIFRERVTLRRDDGEQRTIPLADLRAEADEAGAPLPLALSVAPTPIGDFEDATALDDALLEDIVIAESVVVVEAPPEEDDVEDSGDAESGPPVDRSTGLPIPSSDEPERRPRRRRGRRGGRRNRPGGNRGPSGGPPEGASPAGGG
jgi:hypothetical protein